MWYGSRAFKTTCGSKSLRIVIMQFAQIKKFIILLRGVVIAEGWSFYLLVWY